MQEPHGKLPTPSQGIRKKEYCVGSPNEYLRNNNSRGRRRVHLLRRIFGGTRPDMDGHMGREVPDHDAIGAIDGLDGLHL